MKNLSNLEKKINSELTTKIKSTKIKHNHIYINIENENLLEVILFLKNNNETKFKQLIDITAVDYPENDRRFKVVYLLLSHEFNSRIHIDFFINELIFFWEKFMTNKQIVTNKSTVANFPL